MDRRASLAMTDEGDRDDDHSVIARSDTTTPSLRGFEKAVAIYFFYELGQWIAALRSR